MIGRLLVTGAAGGLGRVLRAGLAGYADTLRLSDVAAMGPAGRNEEVVISDLADRQAVLALVEGCDGIVHLGGLAGEAAFDELLDAADWRARLRRPKRFPCSIPATQP